MGVGRGLVGWWQLRSATAANTGLAASAGGVPGMDKLVHAPNRGSPPPSIPPTLMSEAHCEQFATAQGLQMPPSRPKPSAQAAQVPAPVPQSVQLAT